MSNLAPTDFYLPFTVEDYFDLELFAEVYMEWKSGMSHPIVAKTGVIDFVGNQRLYSVFETAQALTTLMHQIFYSSLQTSAAFWAYACAWFLFFMEFLFWWASLGAGAGPDFEGDY